MNEQERNKAAVRGAIDAFNRQDLALYWSFHTDDTTSWEVYFPEPLTKAQMSEFVPKLWRAYPDWTIQTKTMIAQGNRVVVENVMTATFAGNYEGVKATGRTFSVREAVFFVMQDGKIKDVRVYLDRKSQDEQLGLGESDYGIG